MASPDPAVADLVVELGSLWREVLMIESIDESTNFFDAGGDSLQLVRVIAKAKTRGIRIPVTLFVANPTLGALSEALRHGSGEPRVAVERNSTTEVPLLPSQVRYFEWPIENHNEYTTTVAAASGQRVQPDLMARALSILASRHPALRLTFPDGAGGRRGRVADTGSGCFRYRVVSAADIAEPDRERFVEDAILDLEQSISVALGPLWGCLYVDELDGGGLLCLVFHQLVADDPSIHILVEDLQELYAAVRESGPADADDATTRVDTLTHAFEFRNLAEAAPEQAASFWLGRRWQDAGRLPRKQAGSSADIQGAKRFQQVVERDCADRLTRSRGLVGATSEEVLISAVAMAIGAVADSDVVSLAVNRSGRAPLADTYDLDRAVGYLVLSTPYLLELGSAGSRHGLFALTDQIQAHRERETVWAALRYVAEHRGQLASIAAPELQLVYRGVHQDVWREPFRARWTRVSGPRAGQLPRPITVYADIVTGVLNLTWTYSGELLDDQTVADLAEATVRSLARFVRARSG